MSILTSTSNNSLLYTLYGASIVTLGILLYKGVKLLKNKSNKKIKNGILDLMKDTPILYIKSLSDITGCKIYAKCEHYLPYTSKDRMIKNIILEARE